MEHVEHVLLVAVDHAVEGEDPVEIVVEAHAAEIVVGGLAGIVVEVLAEIVAVVLAEIAAAEYLAVQQTAVVDLAGTAAAEGVEVLAETVAVGLVGTGQDLHREDSVAAHVLSIGRM